MTEKKELESVFTLIQLEEVGGDLCLPKGVIASITPLGIPIVISNDWDDKAPDINSELKHEHIRKIAHLEEGANAFAIGEPGYTSHNDSTYEIYFWPVQFYRVETKG